jgi:hypothetical protein
MLLLLHVSTAPTIDPFASELAALAEKRKARVAAMCEMKVEARLLQTV